MALRTLPQLPSPLMAPSTNQGSCIIAIHVCTTAMLLVKIAEALLLWCRLIFIMDVLKSTIYIVGSVPPFSSLLPLRALAGNFIVACPSPHQGLKLRAFNSSSGRSPIKAAKWVLVASLLSLPLTTIHPLEARPLFCLSSRSSVFLTDIFGSSMCTTTRWRLGSSLTPTARSCSPSLIVNDCC